MEKNSAKISEKLTSEQKALAEEALRYLGDVRDVWQVMAARVALEKLLREGA